MSTKYHNGKTVKDRDLLIESASAKYGEFLTELGFDWQKDPNMNDTPRRVAKSYIDDLWSGVFNDAPNITAFPNEDKYDGMVFQGDITLNSMCSHHSLPFIGKAHVAYLPGKTMIGLSKLNRIVEYFARRPQVQENLTMQIVEYMNKMCDGNLGVAVMIEAKHMCACVRGVKHDSTMITTKLTGNFLTVDSVKDEFYENIKRMNRG